MQAAQGAVGAVLRTSLISSNQTTAAAILAQCLTAQKTATDKCSRLSDLASSAESLISVFQ